MAKKYTTRKLELFALHGTTLANSKQQALNYKQFFSLIQTIPDSERIFKHPYKLIAIPVVTIKDDKVWFVAYEGEEGVKPLIFNMNDASERLETLGRGEILATKTHGLIDLKTREIILEYNQKGAKANDIALTFEELGRMHGNYMSLTLEFTPLVKKDFTKEIAQFKKIKVARVSLVKPNPSWADDHDSISNLGDDSEARVIHLEVHAERKGTLSRSNGIIQMLNDWISKRLPNLRGASVTGVRQGESEETTVSLIKNIEHQRIRVLQTDDGYVDGLDIRKKIEKFSDERAEP